MTHLHNYNNNNHQDTVEIVKDEKDNNNNNNNREISSPSSLRLPPSPTRKLPISGFPFLSKEQSMVGNLTTTAISTHHHTHRNTLLYRKSLIHLQRQVAAWYSRFTQELLLLPLAVPQSNTTTNNSSTTSNRCDDDWYPQEQQLMNGFHRMIHRMDRNLIICNLKDQKDNLQQRMNHIQNIITQQSQTISLLLSSLLSSHPNTFLHLIRELQQLAQDVHTLQIQSNKRHEQMYAKLNHIASLVQTSLMETNAQRYATCTHLQQQLQQCTTMNQNKRQNFLLQIQQLKHDIQTITQERMKQDEEIVHMIVQHRTMLEQVMMLCLDL